MKNQAYTSARTSFATGVRKATLSLAMILSAASGASAQCSQGWWDGNVFGYAGVLDPYAITGYAPTFSPVEITDWGVFSHGGSPTLYVCGDLQTIGGSLTAAGLAKREGSRWISVDRLCPELSNPITEFYPPSPLSGMVATCMQDVDPDGPGPREPVLVVGYGLHHAPAVSIHDGATFTYAAMNGESSSGIWDMVGWDSNGDGSTELYIAGDFSNYDDIDYTDALDITVMDMLHPENGFRTVGLSWGTPESSFLTMTLHNDGSGERLYVAGEGGFEGVEGAVSIARFDGETWSAVGDSSAFTRIRFLTPFTTGSTTRLLAFDSNFWSEWNGTSWTNHSYPIGYRIDNNDGKLAAFRTQENGQDVVYYAVVSNFENVTNQNTAVVRYDGTTSQIIVSDPAIQYVGGPMNTLGKHDFGRGLRLVSSGMYVVDTVTGRSEVRGLYEWTGTQWKAAFQPTVEQDRPVRTKSGLLADLDGIGPQGNSVIVYGTGPVGTGQAISSWNGSSWTPLAQGLPSIVTGIDSSSNRINSLNTNIRRVAASRTPAASEQLLAVVEAYDQTADQTQSKCYTRNLSGNWTQLGVGNAGLFNGDLDALWADFGSGSIPVMFGRFGSRVTGTTFDGIAYWTGSDWSSLGSGLTSCSDPLSSNDTVYWAVAFDADGAGPQADSLFVSGRFTHAGGVATPHNLARWNGSAWFDAGTGLPDLNLCGNSGTPSTLLVHNGLLYAVVHLSFSSHAIYQWNGSSWVDLAKTVPSSLFTSGDLGDGVPRLFYPTALTRAQAPYLFRQPGSGLIAEVNFSGEDTVHTELGFGFWPNAILPYRVDARQGSVFVGTFNGVGGVFTHGACDPENPVSYGHIGINAIDSPGVAFWTTSCVQVCPPDFNHSASVTVQDIFDFLAAWFAGASAADFNTSGSVTVQDIFDFLAAWFAGCP